MKSKTMTVKEAIVLLEKIPNKEMVMLIDCPFCGKGSQIAEISECVILKNNWSEKEQ